MGLIVLGEIGDMIEAGTLFDALATIDKPGVELFIGDGDRPYNVIVGYTHEKLFYRGLERIMVCDVKLNFFHATAQLFLVFVKLREHVGGFPVRVDNLHLQVHQLRQRTVPGFRIDARRVFTVLQGLKELLVNLVEPCFESSLARILPQLAHPFAIRDVVDQQPDEHSHDHAYRS